MKVHPYQLRCTNVDTGRLRAAFLTTSLSIVLTLAIGLARNIQNKTDQSSGQSVARIELRKKNSSTGNNFQFQSQLIPHGVSRVFVPGYPEIYLISPDGAIFSVLSDGSTSKVLE